MTLISKRGLEGARIDGATSRRLDNPAVKLLIGASLASSSLASAAGPRDRIAPPLSMICHPLLNGEPTEDATVYLLSGNVLITKAAGQTVPISTAGRPMFLSSLRDHGIVSSSWADHERSGPIVIRHLYWKTGTRPRRLVSTERFDFRRQTIASSVEHGDMCHHSAP